MLSLAKFHDKCRFCLQNTVSASKRCKDWKMHSRLSQFHVKMLSLAKFHVNVDFAYKTQSPFLKDVKTRKCFSQISPKTSTRPR